MGAMVVMVDMEVMDMERGLLMLKLKPLLSQDTMVDMDAAMVVMEVMVVTDMERGPLMPSQDIPEVMEVMEAMEGMAVVMEAMEVTDMERDLLSLDIMVAMAAAMVDMVVMVVMEDIAVKSYLYYISPLTKIIIPPQDKS